MNQLRGGCDASAVATSGEWAYELCDKNNDPSEFVRNCVQTDNGNDLQF